MDGHFTRQGNKSQNWSPESGRGSSSFEVAFVFDRNHCLDKANNQTQRDQICGSDALVSSVRAANLMPADDYRSFGSEVVVAS
jgi:hypothetical protein